MIGKKINQLATELAPVSTDLTIIGDPISGVSKKITLAQLGAIFSGAVSFYTNLAGFPAVGDINVIYCAKDTQKLYLWSGSAYVEVFPSQALLDTYQLRSEKGNANGYASLDSQGKVPISQLPSSIMEYKGTWNASTNTPTLANGTGDTGDVYICNVAGTVNFGAGPITFAVGDYVIYSGTIWQRSSGAVGTVTSVALTVGGDAMSVSGSPVTTSGTLALAFSGTTSQYIRGNGTLANFPTSLVTGTGTINRVTKWSFTSGEIINSGIVDIGGSIYNTLTTPGQFAWQFNGDTSSGLSYGALIVAGTNSSDIALRIENASSTSVYFYVWGDGRVQINNIPNATTDTDRFLVSDNGVIKYRTGAELLSDIGGASASGYVPYTGATTNLDLGTHTLLAAKGTFSSSGSSDTVGITHSSGSGIALNITKGGNGEGLYINKTSGSGNAATIIGTLNATTLVKSGGTSSQFLKADGSVDSTSYGTGSVTSVGLSSATSGVTIGSTPITTSGTITLAIATSSGSQQGLLSSTDWTTFNNKQNALTNPVTGTGTTNYLPKFTGTSTIGNSSISDNGTGRVSIGTTSFNDSFVISNSGAAGWEFSNLGSVITYNRSTSAYIPMTFEASNYILNRGNLGLGVTPSAWSGTNVKAFQFGNSGALANSGTFGTILFNNSYYNSGYKYLTTATSSAYVLDGSTHIWYQAPSGTAGNAISFTQAMTLGSNSGLSIGTTTAASANGLLVAGVAIFNGKTNIVKSHSDYAFTVVNTDSNGYGMYLQAGSTNNAIDVFNAAGSTQLFKLTGTGAATFSSSVTAASTLYLGDDGTYGSTYKTLGLTGTTNGTHRIFAGTSDNLYIAAATGRSISFWTDGSSGTKMFINTVGNVGIGTTSPGNYVLAAEYNGSAYAVMSIKNSSASGYSGAHFLNTAGSLMGHFGYANTSTGGLTDKVYFGSIAAKDVVFTTNDTERMRITSGGNVEINTGSIKTGEPDTGWGRAAIKIGASVSGAAFNVTRYLPVSVDGTVYYINLNSSTP